MIIWTQLHNNFQKYIFMKKICSSSTYKKKKFSIYLQNFSAYQINTSKRIVFQQKLTNLKLYNNTHL
jgi:hypothetical protein